MAPAIPDLPGLTDLHPLGRGGFADVYRGRQAHLNRFVAAKVFRVTLAERAASDQFRAECQAVGRLDGHPNLITVYGADVLPDGRPYIVTEACDTSLLKSVERRGPMSPAEVAEIGLTLATALLFAHSARVLHGDVTPQNVLLRANGAPVLADFGLAVLRDYQGNVASGFTMTHAAPETVRYDGAIDERTDVYGLGSTLYTVLTGAPPIPGRPGEPDAEHGRRVLTEVPARAPGPAWLADLLAGMLAKDPAARPTMNQVADVLAAGDAGAPAPPSAPAPPDGIPRFEAPADSPWAQPGRAPGGPGIEGLSPALGSPVGDETRRRARPGTDAVGADAGPAGDETRLRARTDAPAPERQRKARPRWMVPAAAGAVVLVAVAAGLYLGLGRGGPDPTPPPVTTTTAPAGPASAAVHIQLAPPVDRGTEVVLTWTTDAPAPLDYAVLVGQPGAGPAASIVGRVTSYTVPVDPGRQYCFQVQGTNQSGTVWESNVGPVRGAVCRFTNS